MENEWEGIDLTEFDPKEFDRRVADRRVAQDIKQKDLAEHLGISNSHLSGIENGRAAFSFKVFLQLCVELDVTPDYLLEGTMHSNNVPQSIMDDLRQCNKDYIKIAAAFVKILRDHSK